LELDCVWIRVQHFRGQRLPEAAPDGLIVVPGAADLEAADRLSDAVLQSELSGPFVPVDDRSYTVRITQFPRHR
jgi:hypothetical protein